MKHIAKRTFLVLLLLAVLAVSSVAFIACGDDEDEVALTVPTNVAYDGTTFTWDAVEGADGYYVTVGEQEYEVTEPKYAHITTDGSEVSVSVKAWRAGKKERTVTDAVTANFKFLGKIESVEVKEDGTLSWLPIEFATGYEITIDGAEKVKVSGCEFLEMKEGRHSYQVRPIVEATGSSLYYSYQSPSKVVNKLATINIEKMTYVDGFIQWPSVSGAHSYEVIINSQVVAAENTASRIAYDANDTSFDVQVRANGDGVATFDGKTSDIKRFVYLAPVTSIAVVDGKLVWEGVGGAEGYKVKINGSELPQTFKADELSYDGLVTGQLNRIQILPTATDTVYFSRWSVEFTAQILSTPVLLWNNEYALDGEANANCYWNSVPGASSYTVRFTKPDGTVTTSTVGDGNYYFADAYLTAGTYKIELQATPDSTSGNVYPSSYSKPIEVVRLPSPEAQSENFIVSKSDNFDHGFTANFKNVAGANRYAIYNKDGGVQVGAYMQTPSFKVTGFADANSAEQKQYNFYVRAMGNSALTNNRVVLDSLTSAATTFQITVLAVPTNLAISGYTLTYSAVAGSNGYSVAISNASQSHLSNTTEFDLGRVLDEGNYSIQVCAHGNGSNVLPSPYTTALQVHRLSAPTNIKIGTTNNEGRLLFDGVNGAISYEATISNVGSDVVLPVDEFNNTYQYITTTGTTLVMRAVANEMVGGIYYMTSKDSQTKNFIKLMAPTWAEVKSNNTQLIWVPSVNAQQQSFSPNYRVTDQFGVDRSSEQTSPAMNLAGLEGGRTYEFKVMAIGDGEKFINSDYSDTVSLYRIETPDVKINADRNAYTWPAVANATWYNVFVDGVRVDRQQHVAGKEYTYVPTTMTKLGTYTVEVYAEGDGGIHLIDAAPYTRSQVTSQLTTPVFTFKYSHDAYNVDGAINVTVTEYSPWSNGFTYIIGSANRVSAEPTFSFNTNGKGSFAIGVIANGGGFDDNEVYYLPSQTAGNNINTTLTILGTPTADTIRCNYDGILTWATVDKCAGYKVEMLVNGISFSTTTSDASLNLDRYLREENVSGATNYKEVTSLTVTITALGNGNTTVTGEPIIKPFDTVLH